MTNSCDSEKVTLAECPVGLFWKGDELCLKTEYGNNEGRIDAYIVSSGEFFWGDQPQTIANQRKNMVVPVDTDEAIAALSILDNERIATRSDEATDEQVRKHHRYRILWEDFQTVEKDLRDCALLVGHHYNSLRPVAPAVKAALATPSNEALLREALEAARQLLWHFKQEAPLECQPPYPQLSAALAKIDAALNPPGVE